MNANYETSTYDEWLLDEVRPNAPDAEIHEGYQRMKRLADFVCSLLGIIVFLPLLFLTSVLIKLTSKGPVIYRQKRIGRKGREFTIYKFRSMVDGAERLENNLTDEQIEEYKVKRKLPDDPRVTRVGKALRRASIDEMPQLLNVLLGDMSLVGPRPMLPDEICMYGKTFEKYKKVRPGLTGCWQINSRQNTAMADRAAFDELYINQISLSMDLKILIKTVAVVFSKKGAC